MSLLLALLKRCNNLTKHSNMYMRASLVVQWLRIYLALQGTAVCPLSGKIPHAVEHLSCAPPVEAVSCNCWAHILQLLSPHLATTEACEWPWSPQLESGSHLPWLTKAHISSKDSPQPKNKINNVHDLNKPYDLKMCSRKKIHDNAIKYLHHKSEFIVIWVVIQWKQKWEVLFYKCSFPVTYDAYFFWLSLFIYLSFISLM